MVPAESPVIVVLAPVPVIAPGFKVQFPEGKPFKTTLPEATVQVGCVIVPAIGADGVTGCAFITMLDDAVEIHPDELVTV